MEKSLNYSKFFSELNARLERARERDAQEEMENIHIIINDIAYGFENEKELKNCVIQNTSRKESASLDTIREYLEIRPALRQSFTEDAELKYVFLAFFADQLVG